MKKLAIACLANGLTIQESMGDKPLQSHNAISYLKSKTKRELHFVEFQEKKYCITHAGKYIIKDILLKDMTTNANLLLWRVEDFKMIFKDMFGQGFPNFLNEYDVCIP